MNECLHELFEAQVAARPNDPALICDGQTLTYAELDARANQLARYLRLHGARPQTFVAIYFERSMAPIIAILACLKSGAAYVPIDPTCPADRIRHVLTESWPLLLLTERALLLRAQALFVGGLVRSLEDAAAEIALQSTRCLSRAETGVSPRNLCHVIYTAGATGRPNGVMTEHRSARQFVQAWNHVVSIGPEDRVYQGFSIARDGAIEEIWTAFGSGAALIVGTPQTPRFGDGLAQLFAKTGVTYFSTVASVLATLSPAACELETLRLLVVRGEVCSADLVARWARPNRRLLNVYGPPEATVNTTIAECGVDSPGTSGRPLPGYQVYILDESLCPVAPGETGELFIGGEALARGYLKQPELTQERFIELPTLLKIELGQNRLYRAGDRFRENAAGQLEFRGRIDKPIKARGRRVDFTEPRFSPLRFKRSLRGQLVMYGVLLLLGAWPALRLLSIAAKWLQIGRWG